MNKNMLLYAITITFGLLLLGFVEAHIDIITVNSPTSTDVSATDTPEFNFTVQGTESVYNCSLYLNETLKANDEIYNNTPSILTSVSLPDGTYSWYINCTDDNGGMYQTVTSTLSSDDGYKFDENDDLSLGDSLSTVNVLVDDTYLPDLLRSGTVEADDGTEYDYDVEIQLPVTSTAVVAADVNMHDLDDSYTYPIVYFDLGSGADQSFYKIVIDFDDAWTLKEDENDTSGINYNSSTIELFGKAFTFDQNDVINDDYMTWYGSDTTLLASKGENKTFTYGGGQHVIEVLAGNEDPISALIRIDAETKAVDEGDYTTIGGIQVYVKDIFVSNVGGEDVSVIILRQQ